MAKPSSIPQIIDSITAPWSPHLAATVNDHDVKLAKIDGAFIWHAHPNSDELFYLISGKLTMEMEGPDGTVVAQEMAVGDVLTVPKGLRHKPVADDAVILMIEKQGMVNTGDQVDSERTKEVKDARV
jgi:mannose-6-phosphate isomerase-like protein (cupin superfamily)